MELAWPESSPRGKTFKIKNDLLIVLRIKIGRFYTNANIIIDSIKGTRGISREQKKTYELTKTKAKLVEAKLKSKEALHQAEMETLVQKQRALQMEILHVFSFICSRHYSDTSIY